MCERAGPAQDDWERHWEHYATSAQANPAQRYRARLILSALRLGGGPVRLLDVGSGQGDLAAAVRARAPHAGILGLELSAVGCAIARAKVPDATFLQRNLLDGSEAETGLRSWATHAVCSEVLEHVDEPEALLAGALPYMAPACHMVVTVPGGPMSAFDRHIGHRRHYTPDSLGTLLERAGFPVERSAAAGFPVHNLYRLAVILRGDKLVSDLAGDAALPSRKSSLALMRLFDVAFRANLPASPWGWQIVAIAHVPA